MGPNLGDQKRDHNFDNPPYLANIAAVQVTNYIGAIARMVMVACVQSPFKTGSTGNTGQTHLLLFLRNLADMSRKLALPVSWNKIAFPVPLAHLSLMFG